MADLDSSNDTSPILDLSSEKKLDLSQERTISTGVPVQLSRNLENQREDVRGDLARGLLWLLTLAIGGVLAFVGLGRVDGTVIAQSIFPSLVALAGTALGFYFGSQMGKNSDPGASGGSSGGSTPLVPGPAGAHGAGGGAAGAGAGQAGGGGAAGGGAAPGA